MSELLNKLNDVQREAASYVGGPLLILAGAGSGKTRVLTYRIAYLLEQKICAPWEILAITFTNKAAKEMKERVEGLVGEVAKDIWLGTFHSVCVRILKREIEALGYTRNFNIIDEQDKQKIIKEILKDLDISDKDYPVSTIVYEISSAKDKLKDVKTYRLESMGDYRKEKIADVFEKYQERLKKNDSLDFDDIINLTVELFKKNPDRLEYYQNKFKHILVDEYQDTNHAQFELIRLLVSSHGNVCVVGDESQSIYGFRGADISNILEFEKQYKNAKVVKLEQNYRSTKTILNAANNVINNNKSKLDKKLWTENDEGDKIKYFTAKNEYEEGGYIVDEIDRVARKSGHGYKDFAVLYRTNAQSRAIEEMLIREGVPYRLIGGTKFYSRKEIKDIVAYLKLINNYKDNVSFARIINEPKRGIGDTSIEKMAHLAEEEDLSLYEYISYGTSISSIRAAGSLLEFKNMMDSLIEKKDNLKVSELIKEILDITGYQASLTKEKSTENESRLENIYEFIGVAKEFEEENVDNSLVDFLDSIALISDVDSLENDANSVTLMTMHNAKGLEYPVVFMVGMEEGLFPSRRSIEEDEGVEEERRLCYVGITRAREQLYLTNAKQRTMYGNTTYTLPSRFIEEVPKEYYDEACLENMETRNNMRNTTYNDREYGVAQRKITSSFYSTSGNTIESSSFSGGFGSTPNFGVDVSSFLKNINIGNKVNNESTDIDWIIPGAKVSHKKFGIGTVQNVEAEDDDMKVEIVFERFGMKRLMAKHAGLSKVD